MSIDTDIGYKPSAQLVPHAPNTDIPKSDVWSAIQYVYDTLSALITTVSSAVVLAQFTADAARELALHARAYARSALIGAKQAQHLASDGRELALRAHGAMHRIESRATDAQIALKAQVFN